LPGDRYPGRGGKPTKQRAPPLVTQRGASSSTYIGKVPMTIRSLFRSTILRPTRLSGPRIHDGFSARCCSRSNAAPLKRSLPDVTRHLPATMGTPTPTQPAKRKRNAQTELIVRFIVRYRTDFGRDVWV